MLIGGAPNERIYFATDTNVFAPLMGCALAIAVHEKRLAPPSRNLSSLSTSALVLAACIPWPYDDRRLLYATVPVAVIATIAVHAALFEPLEWLENPVLRWFGTISYGLYLWHFMLISLPWEKLISAPPLVGMIVSPIALAWISWRFVEAPLLGTRGAKRTPHGPLLPSI